MKSTDRRSGSDCKVQRDRRRATVDKIELWVKLFLIRILIYSSASIGRYLCTCPSCALLPFLLLLLSDMWTILNKCQTKQWWRWWWVYKKELFVVVMSISTFTKCGIRTCTLLVYVTWIRATPPLYSFPYLSILLCTIIITGLVGDHRV